MEIVETRPASLLCRCGVAAIVMAVLPLAASAQERFSVECPKVPAKFDIGQMVPADGDRTWVIWTQVADDARVRRWEEAKCTPQPGRGNIPDRTRIECEAGRPGHVVRALMVVDGRYTCWSNLFGGDGGDVPSTPPTSSQGGQVQSGRITVPGLGEIPIPDHDKRDGPHIDPSDPNMAVSLMRQFGGGPTAAVDDMLRLCDTLRADMPASDVDERLASILRLCDQLRAIYP